MKKINIFLDAVSGTSNEFKGWKRCLPCNGSLELSLDEEISQITSLVQELQGVLQVNFKEFRKFSEGMLGQFQSI